MSCSSSKIPVLKQNLSSINFPDLFLNIKYSKLKFDNLEGAFKQISNEDPNSKKYNPDLEFLVEEEESLTKEISLKKEKIKYINEKLAELDKKQEIMKKILNVDINEKEFIDELKNKIRLLPANNIK